MRKAGLLFFLILLLASSQLFAIADELSLATIVSEIGLMKITSVVVPANTVNAFNNTPDFASYTVSGSGTFTNIAYLSTLSNKRSGYFVTISATAMKNGTGSSATYINYTIRCNAVDYTTTGATIPPAVQFLTVSSLSEITASSRPITLIVDATTFNAAVAGSYLGTVTFTFSAQ